MKTRTAKVIHFFASLKVAIILLLLIAAYIVIGTVLPQHGTEALYLERYPATAKLILGLSLDSAYSSPIFIILLILFSINLALCTITSLNGQLRKMKSNYYPYFREEEYAIDGVEESQVQTLLAKQRFSVVEEDGVLRGAKYRWGVLGAAITHLGLIILFLGGAIGTMSSSEEMITLLPGNQHRFEKQGFTVELDDFYMTFEPSGAVKQYYSDVTVIDDNGNRSSETLWVNKPFHHNGLGFYQANFGWTSNLQIFDEQSGEVVVDGLLRNGGSYFYQPKHLTVFLYSYYPEMGIGHDQTPVKMSDREVNPHYLVILYEFGEPIDYYVLGPGEHIHYDGLQISFTHSIAFTGLLVRKDLSYPIVLASFITIILGLIVSFYLYPRFITYKDGKLITSSRRNEWVFYQSIKSTLTKKD
ncbi:MAG: cytochrome c biogenesis protein ResB [Sphaerochaeta sp.]